MPTADSERVACAVNSDTLNLSAHQLLPNRARIRFEVLEADKRPVSAVADHTELRSVREVEVAEDRSRTLLMMFDPTHALDERILSEQFRP